MTTRPYVKAIDISNYRGFPRLHVDGFKRINIIGGLNGSGKSTLLEALFAILDWQNGLVLMRPIQWRQLPPNLNYAHETMFHDMSRPISISGRFRNQDKYDLEVSWGTQSLIGVQNMPPEAIERPGTSTVSADGFRITCHHNGQQVLVRKMVDGGATLAVNDEISLPRKMASGIMYSKYTSNFHADAAQRFTKILQLRQKTRAVEIANSISSEIRDLQLLQIGNQSILHAEISSGALVPLSLVGDGAYTAITAALGVMNAQDGVMIFDEFDSSIHYSKLSKFWEAISEISQEFNCQIFSATHSRESIDAAICGTESSGGSQDLLYLRLDKIDTDIVVTKYDHEELMGAAKEDWEIR